MVVWTRNNQIVEVDELKIEYVDDHMSNTKWVLKSELDIELGRYLTQQEAELAKIRMLNQLYSTSQLEYIEAPSCLDNYLLKYIDYSLEVEYVRDNMGLRHIEYAITPNGDKMVINDQYLR